MTDIEKVRMKTGDKTVPYVFSDVEVQAFLDDEGSVNLASAALLEAWAASYSLNADNEHIGDYSYSQNIVNKMLSLAERLRTSEATIPKMDIASMNLTAGSAITTEEE